MSKDKKGGQGPKPNNVAELPKRCPVCEGKVKKVNFCEEHFIWFKEGLINRKGEKPKDFDKKYQDFLRRQEKAA